MKIDENTPGYVSAGARVADNMKIATAIKQGAPVESFRPQRADHADRDINPAYRRLKVAK